MSYSVYQQLSYSKDHTYKLLQLPAELFSYIKDQENGELVIKSTPPDTDKNEKSLVLCTENTTWRLRQMNHSNTVLLLDNMNVNKLGKSVLSVIPTYEVSPHNNLVGFAKCSYEYELNATDGFIDVSRLPVYSGDSISDDTLNLNSTLTTLDQLLQDSPISNQQFYRNWYELAGCEINGFVHILSQNFITQTLYTLITILISNEFNYNDDHGQIDDVCKMALQQDPKLNSSIVSTILHKFSDVNENSFKLNNSKIAKWFGTQELANTNRTLVSSKDFLLNWKACLPDFYNVSLDVHDLRGTYCSPMEGKIQYINKSDLSQNLSMRFAQLFLLDKLWVLEDFVPFISEFVPPGKKVDSIILKHGKKKALGKGKYVVCPR